MNRLETIEARLAATPELRPYVTASGEAVVFSGRFTMPKANAAGEFITHAPADLRLLLAVAKHAVEYFVENETCPVCHEWVPNDEFKHAGDCALGALLMEVTG